MSVAHRDFKNLLLPDHSDFITDLILQRTGAYLGIPGAGEALAAWFERGDRRGLHEHLVTSGRKEYFLRETLRQLRKDADLLIQQLPRTPSRLVSIGPGNGLIELFLLQSGNISEVLLIDIEKTEDHYHGFNSRGSGYCSLSLTKSFILNNIAPGPNVITCNPWKEPLPTFQYDILISILSMGFHYPCDEYSHFIVRNSAPGGSRMILDKRRGVKDKGFEKLSKDSQLEIISENEKSQRLRIDIFQGEGL